MSDTRGQGSFTDGRDFKQDPDTFCCFEMCGKCCCGGCGALCYNKVNSTPSTCDCERACAIWCTWNGNFNDDLVSQEEQFTCCFCIYPRYIREKRTAEKRKKAGQKKLAKQKLKAFKKKNVASGKDAKGVYTQHFDSYSDSGSDSDASSGPSQMSMNEY
jgi:hypothetical protein